MRPVKIATIVALIALGVSACLDTNPDYKVDDIQMAQDYEQCRAQPDLRWCQRACQLAENNPRIDWCVTDGQ